MAKRRKSEVRDEKQGMAQQRICEEGRSEGNSTAVNSAGDAK